MTNEGMHQARLLPQSTSSVQDLSEKTEAVLLEDIGLKDYSHEQAVVALEELVRRYGGIFKGIFSGMSGGRLDLNPDGVDSKELVQLLILTIWEKADQFKPGSYRDARDARNHFLGWAGRIAKRIFLNADSTLAERRKFENFIEDDAWESTFEPQSITTNPELLEDVAEAIETLSEHGKLVIMAMMEDLRPGSDKVYTDPDKLTELAERIGVARASIRKIRERAIESVKEHLISKGWPEKLKRRNHEHSG